LAAVKLEAENGGLGVAKELLVRVMTVTDIQRYFLFNEDSLTDFAIVQI
jgi:hypothetical protein